VSAASPTPFLSICPVCQNQIDVTAFEPFSKVACPHCGQLVRVRRNFDHFRIIKQIGEGGMSHVYEAEDETLGRRVALKILNRQFSRDAIRVEQFKREALVTARLNHLNVIKLYSTGEDHGYFYIAMELVGGGSLEQRIKNRERLGESEVLKIGLEVAEGLRAAQKGGLIHRDVKPANILFTDTGTAKVVDFGLAIFVGSGDDDNGEIWATPYYVAPEKVMENREDFRSDIFSLGATLYHALTGKPPHKANTSSLSELRQIKAKKVLLEDTGMAFSARTCAVVNRMLAIAPEARHADYDAVVEDLRVAERLVGGGRRLPVSRRQKLIGVGLVGVIAVVASFVAGWIARNTGERAANSIRRTPVVDVVAVSGGGVTQEAGKETLGERFRVARDRLMAGAVAEAKGLFDGLLREGMRQPTANWARFHGIVCALEQGDAKVAKALLEEMAADSDAEGLEFFKRLSGRLLDRKSNRLAVSELGYTRDDEGVMGYLLHGLQQWHLGDLASGVEILRFFFDSMPTYRATMATNGVGASANALDWIPAYAEAFEKRYGADLEMIAAVQALSTGEDLVELQQAIERLDEMKRRLQTGGGIRKLIEEKEQTLKRQEVRLRLADQTRSLAEQQARRQRELEQLNELTEILPSLIHGFDYTKVVEVLQTMSFETAEVKSALEGKVYLYGQAQAFMEQLAQDVTRKPWKGTVRRADGAFQEGSVTSISKTELALTMERGTVVLPISRIAGETLVEMANAYLADVTDSTEHYRRLELIAVFARVVGLQSVSAMIAAPLMEENRAFRMRWLKVL